MVTVQLKKERKDGIKNEDEKTATMVELNNRSRLVYESVKQGYTNNINAHKSTKENQD